jgi:spermidine synthase
VGHWLNLRVVDQISGGRLRPLFRLGEVLSRPSVRLLLLGALAVWVAVLALWPMPVGSGGRLRWSSLWAIGTMGLGGMALEMVLLYAYQSLFGHVYQMVGLVVGTFMLGLSLGGVWAMGAAQRPGASGAAACRRLQVLAAGMVAFAASVPPLIGLVGKTAGGQVWLIAMVGVAGLLTGAQFPLAAAVHLAVTRRTRRSAAAVEAVDHLGGCLGALLTGALLVPVWGTTSCCLGVAALGLSSFVLLTVVRRQAGAA